MESRFHVNRRNFLRAGGVVGAGLVLGTPDLWAEDKSEQQPPPKPKTNIDDAMAIPRTATSMPGPFPGRVVEIHDPQAMPDSKPAADVIHAMFEKGLTTLTAKDPAGSFNLLFTKDDIIGLKINPTGGKLNSTQLDLVDAVIQWLSDNGVPKKNIIIWDRFESMLGEAGYTPERFPGVGLAGLHIMDDAAAMGEKDDDSGWLGADGKHLSAKDFDMNVYYWADIEAPQDNAYLNQHVFNGKESYFGNLLTKKLTKIINMPVFKNTGNGITVATKNIGYGAICNTGRLHRPLFFDVCTEVCAFPVIRDKMVLNITDGLLGQYDGGPMPNAAFVYANNTLLFSTDAFAMDMICQQNMVAKRKSMGIQVNENPMFTDYLTYGEKLGLGVADPEKIEHIRV
ncbi:MAG: DUF362 domain-containing protein [Candidatus Eisenbacteria bacterium]|uniref:DUF362 domain-containing protein n=1 Tax=Eiseniibacteriota bacterium TaxID=2212470 RepID=A0A948S0G8_UNCEI|nr:DUF362 domain-containing protein [Candidatus Eisenbacteria bacterium]MBU1948871.1 DUF362 domain-containing protein [Candidatus Eisenbacteria bacterium]MBU2691564.1 DUF362 domain-containing protein [Candidatus Eisenbacteria bacterium]